MLLISFVYLLFQTVKYYLNSKDTSTLIITNGTVLDVIMEKNTNSDFYFNSFLIEFYLEDGTKLIQKTINQYSFFDKHVKKINIEKRFVQIINNLGGLAHYFHKSFFCVYFFTYLPIKKSYKTSIG